MSYRIKINREAEQEVRDLSANVRAQARQIVRALAQNPRPHRAKELRGKPSMYRVWLAGHWRIVYQVDEVQQLVIILRVRRKEDIDYDSLVSPE